ncbi:hypothetical protein M3Y97_01010000 [Aphelenchoides bicaudatus]|nr:hypothetical protein M3Y97_01010000 [Aphelenchoides bicaudatus]
MSFGALGEEIVERELKKNFSILSNSTQFLTEQERAIVEALQMRLNGNEHLRSEYRSHFLMFFICTLAVYVMFTIFWIVYSFQRYKFERELSQKIRVARAAESSRRLEFYKQIPLVMDRGDKAEEVEFVKNVKIKEKKHVRIDIDEDS